MAGHGVGKQPSAAYLAEDEGHTMIAIAILFIILNTLSVAIRFYARRLNKSTLGSDDLVIPFAWLVNVGLCALGITMVHEAGVGRHLAYVLETDPHKIAAWAKSLYALEWLYLPAVALPKISILLLYLQIFLDRPARITTYVLICILLANWIAYLVASSLQCLPFAYQWDKSIPGGKCFNQRAFYKTVSGPNIATDVIILVLPLKTVWGLRTSVMRKVGLLIVFLTGSVGIIASCVRMASFFQTEAFEDNTFASVKLVGWSIIEPGMYLLAACLMKSRAVFTKIGHKLHLKDAYDHVTRRGDTKRTRATNRGNGGILRLDTIQVTSKSNVGFHRMDSAEKGCARREDDEVEMVKREINNV